MNRIVMLGTGNGVAVDTYNTCFVIQNDNGNFLVDTGGGIEILKKLKQADIDYTSIRDIFISHSHTDHILGLFWFFKRIGYDKVLGIDIDKVNVFCSSVVYEAIQNIAEHVLPGKLWNVVSNMVNYVILNDGDKHDINGIEYTFLDLKSKRVNLFGFECEIDNKKFAFLGDEPLDESLYDRIKGYDYVMHEVFCLESDGDIFHISEIPHSTVRTVSEIMDKLNVKNLVLYHTEETHGNEKKELYTKEAKMYFSGNIIVPNDLDVIEL